MEAGLSHPLVFAPARVLEESSHDLASGLQEGMTSDDLQETLEPLTATFNHLIREPIGKHLAWQWGDVDSRTFAFQDIAKVFKVAIASAYGRVAQFESGNVGACDDFVVGVHFAADTVSHRASYFDFEKVFRYAVHVFCRLSARVERVDSGKRGRDRDGVVRCGEGVSWRKLPWRTAVRSG